MTSDKKWIDKVRQNFDIAMLVRSEERPFYGNPAPEDIPDKYFDIATAVWTLLKDLADLQNIGDVLSPDQIVQLNACYEKFELALKVEENRKAVCALRLENGRLRAKVKRLQQEKDNVEAV